MPADRIAFALNARLPADIRIQGSSEVPPDFHPRFTATVKTYEYRILNRTFADPTRRLNSYFWYGPLDAVIYGSFILGAKILWHIVDFGQSMRTAAEVNERLRRRRMEPVEERREKMRKRH